jgi:hypothetical protein
MRKLKPIARTTSAVANTSALFTRLSVAGVAQFWPAAHALRPAGREAVAAARARLADGRGAS